MYPKHWSVLDIAEFRIIAETYRIYKGNKTDVAHALNLSLRAVRYKIRLYEKLGLIQSQTQSPNIQSKDARK
jgi:hypothetical protein